MRYQLEQRIHTLAQNVIDTPTAGVTGFTAEGVQFSPWQVMPGDGWWTHEYWIATGEIDANDFRKAGQLFWEKLARIVPRISLVSLCYAEYRAQPILILQEDSDTAFLRYTVEQKGAPLMFMDQEHKALSLLLTDSQIPDEFYWYWNDATNSSGYTSRLLLMLAAVETLVNKPVTKGRPQMDYAKLEAILGLELKREFWGEEGNSTNALRHRLTHGRYFGPDDGGKNHLGLLHNRIMAYFNETIFKEKLIEESVTKPQRHPFGNHILGQSFIRPKEGAKLALAYVYSDLDINSNFTHYERVVDDKLWDTY